jgi:predicted methyltransferase MtxX (methanogen marker protein 4)
LSALGLDRNEGNIILAKLRVLVSNAQSDYALNPDSEIPVTDEGRFIDCGRRAGYLQGVMDRLAIFIDAAEEYGATHIGWG